MRQFIITAVALLTSALSINAQLLWKVTAPSGDKTSYLFGTHHLAPKSVLDSVPGLIEALNSADIVYGELDMAKSQTPEVQQQMMAMAMAPADSTLTTLLTAQQIDSLTTMLHKYMGPAASVTQLAQMKPAMVSTMLALMQTMLVFPGFDPNAQLDTQVQKLAAAEGKEIRGLETPEMQFRALFGGSIVSQAEDLMDLVRNDDKAASIAKRLASAYLSGDLDAMLAIMEDPHAGGNGRDWCERMLYARNANWMRILAGLIPTATVFIAVGAGHLPGDNGLINLLRKEGYNVTPAEK